MSSERSLNIARIVLGVTTVLVLSLLLVVVIEYKEGWWRTQSPSLTIITIIEPLNSPFPPNASLSPTHSAVENNVPEEVAHKKGRRRKGKNKNKKIEPAFQALVGKMWDADKENRVEDLQLDWGRPVNQAADEDEPMKPLFSYVNEEQLENNKLYSSLIQIYNNTSIFHPPVCVTEPSMEGDRLADINNFFDIITNTTVFSLAYSYLKSKGKASSNWEEFRPKLFALWFGTYSRCEGPLGSSGWEHVFSGELRPDIVEGHHNWVRYYLQERAGNITYRGYYSYTEVVGTIQYEWEGRLKKIGGFFIRTSPAFDFSLFSACALAHPGEEGCVYQLEGSHLYVNTFFEECKDQSATCLATSYPSLPRA